MMLHCY